MIGETILHYKIIEKLGEGGMGVVYKAEDIKLKRFVALKFLPPHTASSKDELARFNQEAQAAAVLNHPNICTIYAIEEDNDQQFIVMEYVDGVTLSKKIEQSPLKMNDAVSYSIQIGEALQEAHNNGIVHRDIKTENIMVNSKNQIKVMDFGLAKLKGSIRLTKTSSTVGTLAYMAPEQIQGGEVDARSDIFSFGVVLFEMLTGILPFRGEHDASIMYSIMNEEPEPLQKYIPDANSDLIHVINRILEKDPEDRYQSMKDIVIELSRIKKKTGNVSRKTISYSPSSTKELPVREDVQKETRATKKKLWLITGSLAAVIVLAALSYFLFIKNSAPSLPPMKTVGVISYPGIEVEPAFSPDGNSIAFVWNGGKGSNYNIYVKLLGTNSQLQLTHEHGEDSYPVWTYGRGIYLPAWSPDGRYIAFGQSENGSDAYFIIPSFGGEKRKIADVKHAGDGIDWSPDGKELVVSATDSSGQQPPGLMLISIATGKKRQLTLPDMNAWPYGDYMPKFSPDGSQIVFIHSFGYYVTDLYIIPSKGGKEKRLTFDSLDIETDSWTKDGKQIVFSSNRSGNLGLWRVSSEGGTSTPVAAAGSNIGDITISKKGNELAYGSTVYNINIWKVNLGSPDSKLPKELIISSQSQAEADYSPDGKYIAFTSNRSGSFEIWRCNGDGTNPVQLTSIGGQLTGSPRWSPNGKLIVFDSRLTGTSEIFVINPNGGTPRQVTFNKSTNQVPNWSRDGKWIYFGSDRTGKFQIWKKPVDGGKAVQVTQHGGLFATESFDDKYLYYCNLNYDICKMPLPNGEEHPIVKNLSKGDWAGWQLMKNGIYFVRPDSSGLGHIYFYDFKSKKTKPIFVTKKLILPVSHNIEISPDGRFLLYDQIDHVSSQIMMIKNFH